MYEINEASKPPKHSLSIADLIEEKKSYQQIIRGQLNYIELLLTEKARVLPPEAVYGNKIFKVFSDIKEVLSTDRTAKILVFSAWTEALTIMGKLFDNHQIKYSNCDSITQKITLVTQLEQFRYDPETRILLLNAIKQSTGLTLTQANHIFLMDPIDEASELQAVGRAYRLGQLKCTNIYRYTTDQD